MVSFDRMVRAIRLNRLDSGFLACLGIKLGLLFPIQQNSHGNSTECLFFYRIKLHLTIPWGLNIFHKLLMAHSTEFVCDSTESQLLLYFVHLQAIECAYELNEAFRKASKHVPKLEQAPLDSDCSLLCARFRAHLYPHYSVECCCFTLVLYIFHSILPCSCLRGVLRSFQVFWRF